MDPGDSFLLFTSSLMKTRYSTFAALSFLVYDHILTFDAEKQFVWRSPWSFGKVLFIVSRHFGLFALMFNAHSLRRFQICLSCQIFRAWEGIAVMLAVMITEVILMTRIYAVYDRSKIILAVMGVLYGANIAGTALIVYMDRGFSYFLCWLPAFGFETLLVLIMLYKGLRTRDRGLNSPLLNVVVRDSIVYFLAIFASLFVDCLIWGLSPQTFNVELSGCWTIAASCAFGSRLLLNIRERYFREQSFVGVETKPQFKSALSSVVSVV
ncbi:hypothetical protein JB92DRAFT_857419 [Gautieria morchelliformis]|nr:hypothetical protein JB92DRAFT_857419 [Gautieria morchelliformis]